MVLWGWWVCARRRSSGRKLKKRQRYQQRVQRRRWRILRGDLLPSSNSVNLLICSLLSVFQYCNTYFKSIRPSRAVLLKDPTAAGWRYWDLNWQSVKALTTEPPFPRTTMSHGHYFQYGNMKHFINETSLSWSEGWASRACLPGLDVEVVGGPSVFEVMNSSSKHHGQNFQFGEPVLGQVQAQNSH